MALSHAIMTALLEDDMSGYELAKSFDSALGFFWRASHQQIYQELKKLGDRGYLVGRPVQQDGRPGKIVYTLTGDGRAAMEEWVLGNSRYQEAKDDLLVKMANLSLVNAPHLIAEIENRREQVMAKLYVYERICRRHYESPASLPVRRQGVHLALRAGICQGEQFLQWCDEALAVLAALEKKS